MTDTTAGAIDHKKKGRVIDARLAVERAVRHINLYPHGAATPLVRDMRTALGNLIEEVERS